MYLLNVLLNPLQQRSLVQVTSIQVSIRLHLFAGEESPWTNTIVEGNDDDIMISCLDDGSTIHVRTGIRCETTTLNENEDGMKLRDIRRRVNISEETIFRGTLFDTSRRSRKTMSAVLSAVSKMRFEDEDILPCLLVALRFLWSVL